MFHQRRHLCGDPRRQGRLHERSRREFRQSHRLRRDQRKLANCWPLAGALAPRRTFVIAVTAGAARQPRLCARGIVIERLGLQRDLALRDVQSRDGSRSPFLAAITISLATAMAAGSWRSTNSSLRSAASNAAVSAAISAGPNRGSCSASRIARIGTINASITPRRRRIA